MPRKDLYHDVVVEALEASGWTITDDPLHVEFGTVDLYVDLGAERTVVGAQMGDLKIAIEIKSFVGASAVRDLEMAVGQYNVYRDTLSANESDRAMYLAIPQRVYKKVFKTEFGRLIVQRQRMLLVAFDEREGDLEWLPDPTKSFGTSSVG